MTDKLRRFISQFPQIKRALLGIKGFFGTVMLAFADGVIWILGPFVTLRVGQLGSSRIGHLAVNTELYLKRQVLSPKPKRERHIFLCDTPANAQLLKMIKRRVIVINPWIWPDVEKARTRNWWVDLPFETNEYDEFNTVPPQLSFTPEEERQGRALLLSMGIPADAKYVCIHARDSAYLAQIGPDKDWSYHDFRDCSIDNYMKAADYLTKQGYYVVRMGAVVEKALEADHPMIIDYATRHRTDFGDIYLPARCEFFLGNTSGLFIISTIFQVPCACANWVPIVLTPLQKRDVYIPKMVWSADLERYLTFREMIDCGAYQWNAGELYCQAGLRTEENVADDICDLAVEMCECIKENRAETADDMDLRRRYRELFTPEMDCFHSPARIGAMFLRKHRELLA